MHVSTTQRRRGSLSLDPIPPCYSCMCINDLIHCCAVVLERRRGIKAGTICTPILYTVPRSSQIFRSVKKHVLDMLLPRYVHRYRPRSYAEHLVHGSRLACSSRLNDGAVRCIRIEIVSDMRLQCKMSVPNELLLPRLLCSYSQPISS